MTSKSFKLQFAILAAILTVSTSVAVASGPGIPVPLPPTQPPSLTAAFAGHGMPVPLTTTKRASSMYVTKV